VQTATETLAQELVKVPTRHRHSLTRRLRALEQSVRAGRPADEPLTKLEADIRRFREIYDKRLANLPRPTYPLDLPIADKREQIAAAISASQVVIVSGETGSGKTTQLPKICLGLGRGVAGLIGHTQPRRIAARSVATRIAQELETPLGAAVGYKVRFHDRTSPDSYIKLMTDGILLAETQHDRYLEHYDTIIIDEAHERSLNIDFLLGYLKQLLPKRPDLKLIITSATIDPQSFSRHFNNAPVIEVSGRTYPVQIRYKPAVIEDGEEDPDPVEAILAAVDELWSSRATTSAPALSPSPGTPGEGRDAGSSGTTGGATPPADIPPLPHAGEGRGEGRAPETSASARGDILLFLSGEREIRETTEALSKHRPVGVDILPLYARLSSEEQMRVFAPHSQPRIVLATNVAETSLTVPGIKYVIDPGFARINRYSPRTRVSRLPIERISQASANQRAGRCGRVSEGIAIRLYSEDDFLARPQFTDPEILRTNLASVILQMKALRLGDIQDFPFIEPPDYRMIRDGLATLHELGAIDADNQLTPLGRDLAKLPIDPRISRMVLEAVREGCLPQVLIIASALSIQDPRERPLDKQQPADEAHARFNDERSDFLGYLKLWLAFHDELERLSHSKLRKWCKDNFLSYVRMREWLDVHQQLRAMAHEVFSIHHNPRRVQKISPDEMPPKHLDAIHRALLSGLLSNVGYRSDAHEYTGISSKKFNIFPGSALFKSNPPWVMAAELVETTRLYARTVASIRPIWIEQLADHIVKRTYTDPTWHMQSAQVMAYEKVTFGGITLVPRRSVHYGPVDPQQSRELFIHEALIKGNYKTEAEFFKNNQKLVAEVLSIEAKLRTRNILVESAKQFRFYDERLPHAVFSGATLDKWRNHAERGRPTILFMQPRHVMTRDVRIDAADYPDELRIGEITIPLRYTYDVARTDDGMTATIPLAALNQLSQEPFEWMVPGWLKDKVTALIKSLPKALRTKFVPVPETVEKVMPPLREAAVDGHSMKNPHPALSRSTGRGEEGSGSLLDKLADQLGKISGEYIDRNAFDLTALEPWRRMNFEVIDEQKQIVKVGRDLDAIKRELGLRARDTFRSQLPPSEWNRDGLTKWDFEALPDRVESRINGTTLQGYPALIDAGRTVSLRLYDSPEAAREANRSGVRRLLTLQLKEEVKWLSRKLPHFEDMALFYAPIGSEEDLKADIVTAATERALEDPANVRTREQFIARSHAAWQRLTESGQALAELVGQILQQFQNLSVELEKPVAPLLEPSILEMRRHLHTLIYNGFIADTPPQWLAHFPRYLKAVEVRLKKLLNAGLSRDATAEGEIAPLVEQYEARRKKHEKEGIIDPELEQYRWMLEEYRVSLFAQELKTAIPVSAKRLEAQWGKVRQ
jgi:ATP-dependent helicase HrpA